MAQATVVTNVAKSIFSNLVGGLGGTAPNYQAIGSGSTTAAVTDTVLTTEYTTGTWAGYARVNATPTRVTTSQTNDTLQWVATWTAGAAQSVFEGGNFDAATVGNLCVHGSYAAAVGLSSGDSVQQTIKLQFS